MNSTAAVRALQALGHPQRLKIFRTLVREGTNGLIAGALASRIKATPAATSFHLKELDRAGLIRPTRDGRYIRYAVDIEGMRQLLTYLTEDCCRNQPELCGGIVAAVEAPCPAHGDKS